MMLTTRHGIAGGAGEQNREDVPGKHRTGHAPVFARYVLSIRPARSAVPCLTIAFYLRDLCASCIFSPLKKGLFAAPSPSRTQHEAIEAQKQMVNSPNHTVVYIPVGPMGVPLTGTMNVAEPKR